MVSSKKITMLVDCIHCNETYPIKVNPMDFSKWMMGETLIQDALPYLNAGERELLISNTCDTCWDEMFGASSDDTDVDDEE